MTIVFSFIEFSMLNYITITISIIAIIYNIFFIQSGRKQSPEVHASKYLIYLGITNISFIVLSFLIPDLLLRSPYNEVETQIYLAYNVFRGLLFSIPSLITYGVIFLIFGLKNRQQLKSYIMISGILWIIYYSVNVIVLNGELYMILFQISGVDVWTLTTIFIIISFFGWLTLIGFILLIVHGFKNNDSNMLYAGLVYFIGFVLSFIIPLFITY
ncbi:MAG: hypothetical protein MUP85_07055 [Candidatus Lokiarchaeota archaeon]|nr:hypothetical protein [Candidatus Lokiarchaeota archaeon]